MHSTLTAALLLLVIFMEDRRHMVDAWRWSSLDKEPCDEIKYNLDSAFLLNNYIDFYWYFKLNCALHPSSYTFIPPPIISSLLL